MSVLNSAEPIAAAIVARLASITVLGGAETDIGATVFQGRRKVDETMLPCVTVIEGEDDPSTRAAPATNVKIAQRYAVFAYLPCDPNNPNVAAHRAIRDIKRALFNTDGRPDRTLGRQVGDVRYLGREIGPRADGAAFVVAAVEIEIEFVEDLAAP